MSARDFPGRLMFPFEGVSLTEEFIERVRERYNAELEARLAVARDAGCRLAVKDFNANQVGFLGSLPSQSGINQMTWSFVMLSPGEEPPQKEGWSIYEFRGDQAVGRPA